MIYMFCVDVIVKFKKIRKFIWFMKKRSWIILIVIVIVALAVIYIYKNGNQNHDEFAKCLSDKGLVLASHPSCGYCKYQKELFGESFKYLSVRNCEEDRDWCVTNGVSGYPTWILANGEKHPGAKSLNDLAELSGCDI